MAATDLIFVFFVYFLMYAALPFALIYAALPRQTRNIIYSIVPKWKREFVVVYFRKFATAIPLTYYVIPEEKTRMGTIGKGVYDLHSDNALPDKPYFKHRLHFLVNEGNSIPVKAEIDDLDINKKIFIHKGKPFGQKIVFLRESPREFICPKCKESIVPDTNVIRTWAFRVKSALTTQAYDFIYGEKRQWAFIIAIIAAAIAIIVGLYALSEFQRYKPLVETIYQNTIIGNQTMVIKQK